LRVNCLKGSMREPFPVVATALSAMVLLVV
jgi:hypothetical protein